MMNNYGSIVVKIQIFSMISIVVSSLMKSNQVKEKILLQSRWFNEPIRELY